MYCSASRLEQGTSADRQLAKFRETGNLHDVVDMLVRETAEGVRVTRRILEMFRNDVTVTKRPFLLVYLPLKDNIQAQLDGHGDPAEPLVALFRHDFDLVDPSARLVALARERGAASVAPGHYSAEGNGAVAEAVAERIAALKVE